MRAWIEDSYPRVPVSDAMEVGPDQLFRFTITEACNTSRLRFVVCDAGRVQNVPLNARPDSLDLAPSDVLDIRLTIRE